MRTREKAEVERELARRAEIERREAELTAQVAAGEAALLRRSIRAARKAAKQKAPQSSVAASPPAAPSPRDARDRAAEMPASKMTWRWVSVDEFRRLEEQRQLRTSRVFGPRQFGPAV